MCLEWLLLSHNLFTLPPLPLPFLSSSSLCVQFFLSSRPSNIFLTVREPWPATRSQKKDARPESPTRLANYSRVVLCGVSSMLSLGPRQVQSACVLLPDTISGATVKRRSYSSWDIHNLGSLKRLLVQSEEARSSRTGKPRL